MAKSDFKYAVMGSMLTLGVLASPVTAEEIKHETRFAVKFGGLDIAKVKFDINFDDDSYSLKGAGHTAGLVNWFTSGTGEVFSEGKLKKTDLKPKAHKVSVVQKKKKPESVRLAFTNDKVSDVELKYNKKPKVRKAPNYVPVEAQHLAAVLDPASPIIIPVTGKDARDGRKVCNQRFPIFDGETRYDIKLRYLSTKPVNTAGYDGHAYVCRLRYIPVAGHKKNHRNVKEMAANKNMEIWLAPMGGVSVFTPIKISVSTKYGRFSAIPEYFGSPTQ